MLVKADASQALATGCGIALNIAGLICGILFASAAGSKHRNKFFYVGIVIQAAAMIGIALGGGALFMIVAMIACYNIGNQFAGESIYKVWTQESFPSEARASMQGFINGFSRLWLRSVRPCHTVSGCTGADSDNYVWICSNRTHQRGCRHNHASPAEKVRRRTDVKGE